MLSLWIFLPIIPLADSTHIRWLGCDANDIGFIYIILLWPQRLEGYFLVFKYFDILFIVFLIF